MSAESRRQRNRISQKAFRTRQALRIKELEERLGQEPAQGDDRTAQLYDVNNTLRMQLLECHKKLSSLQISMNTLATSTASVLGLDTSQEVSIYSISKLSPSGQLLMLPDERFTTAL